MTRRLGKKEGCDLDTDILYEQKGRIVLITINRESALNTLTPESAKTLGNAWKRFRDDEEAWVAVITGAGDRAFCAGYEMSEEALALKGAKESLATIPTTFDIWKPTIAAINGYCIAGGWWIAQECDLRIASETAEFGITQVKWGLMPAFSATLSRHLMPGHALELLLTGERINARRASEMGFVNEVVSEGKALERAMEIAETICANGPAAVRMSKELFYRGMTLSREAAFELTWERYAENEATRDAKEGVSAFMERRKPVFKNE